MSTDRYDFARHRYIWDSSGGSIPLLIENVNEIPSVEVIAHSLAHICRWTGHTRVFYSVAQHCMLASLMVPEWCALEALMHDAAECLTGDVSSPLKRQLRSAQLQEITLWFDAGLAGREQLMIGGDSGRLVKKADELLARLEARDLLGIGPAQLAAHFGADCDPQDTEEWEMVTRVRCVQPVGPEIAKRWWLMRYKDLVRA